MDKEKALQMALMISDIAEGAGALVDSIKLIASGLDDVANILREYATSD
jgi:hypothetical protein